jgi:C4-dicarboxylate transporter, DctM subunit
MLTALFHGMVALRRLARRLPLSAWRVGFPAREASILPRVLPFLAIVAGVLYVLYGGIATPSEAAGVGALFCMLLVVVIYRICAAGRLRGGRSWALDHARVGDDPDDHRRLGAVQLYARASSSPSRSPPGSPTLDVNRWVLMAMINVFLLVCGFFLPPVAVILMTAPILLPIVTSVGFDPYWFAVILTINMEIGLITPPVGLNLYVINGIAPDIRLHDRGDRHPEHLPRDRDLAAGHTHGGTNLTRRRGKSAAPFSAAG